MDFRLLVQAVLASSDLMSSERSLPSARVPLERACCWASFMTVPMSRGVGGVPLLLAVS